MKKANSQNSEPATIERRRVTTNCFEKIAFAGAKGTLFLGRGRILEQAFDHIQDTGNNALLLLINRCTNPKNDEDNDKDMHKLLNMTEANAVSPDDYKRFIGHLSSFLHEMRASPANRFSYKLDDFYAMGSYKANKDRMAQGTAKAHLYLMTKTKAYKRHFRDAAKRKSEKDGNSRIEQQEQSAWERICCLGNCRWGPRLGQSINPPIQANHTEEVEPPDTGGGFTRDGATSLGTIDECVANAGIGFGMRINNFGACDSTDDQMVNSGVAATKGEE